MEELNNNLVEETMEVIEPVGVLESMESNEFLNSKNVAGIALGVAAVVAAGYGVKKLWGKIKSKGTTSEITVEINEVPVVETEKEIQEETK